MSRLREVPESFWRTLHGLERGRGWPPADPDEIARFVEAADRHRLLPIAAAVHRPGHPVGDALGARLAEQSREIEARAAEQGRTLERVVAALEPLSYIGIKGIDYRQRLYGDPRLRPMNDVDLLIRPEDRPAHLAALTRAGFEGPLPAGEFATVFLDPSNRVIVDLYRAFTHSQRVDIDYRSVWARAERSEGRLPVLCCSHAIVSQALTLASVEYVTHLRKYLDLWLLVRDRSAVAEALELAGAWRMRRVVWVALTLLGRVVPEVRDEPWYADVDGLLGRRERRWIEGQILPATPVLRTSPRLARLWRKFGLIDSPGQRLSFAVARVAAGGFTRRAPAKSVRE